MRSAARAYCAIRIRILELKRERQQRQCSGGWLRTALSSVLSMLAATVTAMLVRAAATTDLSDPPPALPRLDWVPGSDWMSVTSFGARGDGKTDDTAALQAAFDAINDTARGSKTVHIPPGVFLVSATLGVGPAMDALVVGHGSASVVKWSPEAPCPPASGQGPARGSGCAILRTDGYAYSRFVGVVWDGSGVADVGVDHASETKLANRSKPLRPPYFETFIMHENSAFVNFNGSGVRTGVCPEGATCMESAETLYRNCLWANSTFGVSLLEFNDYDHTFDGCHFSDHQIAINAPHGIAYVRNTRFERSNVTDVLTPAGDHFNAHRCVSVGSRAFVSTSASEFDCNVKIFNVLVADFWGPHAIVASCPGPFVLLDSVFVARNRSDATVNAFVSFGNPSLSVSSVVAGNNKITPPSATLYAHQNTSIKDFLLTELPAAGAVPPATLTTGTHFFRSHWSEHVWHRLFDAVRDFGAAGNGTADDTRAVAATVAAAAKAGGNTVAYFPTGEYKVTSQVVLKCGSPPCNFTVAGTGVRFVLAAKPGSGPPPPPPPRGDPSGAAVLVCASDGFDLTLRGFSASGGTAGVVVTRDGGVCSGAAANATQKSPSTTAVGSTQADAATVPASASAAAAAAAAGTFSLRIDSLGVATTWATSDGVVLRNLGSSDVVHVFRLNGVLNVSACSDATVLATFHQGKTSLSQHGGKGFVGALTQVTGDAAPHSIVSGGSDWVVGDEYHEGPGVAILLEGGTPTQRVTVSQTKMNNGAPPSVVLDRWAGQFMLVGANSAFNAFHLNGTVAAGGAAGVGLVACSFSHGAPNVDVGGLAPLLANNLKDYVVPANKSFNAVADAYPRGAERGAAWMVSMFDKLRELGRVDWRVKYPHLLDPEAE